MSMGAYSRFSNLKARRVSRDSEVSEGGERGRPSLPLILTVTSTATFFGGALNLHQSVDTLRVVTTGLL